MARGRRKSRFAGKTTANAKQQKSKGNAYGYLLLPRGVNMFKEEPGSRVELDFLPYVVSDPKHPDRDTELEIAIPGEQWYKRPFKLHRNVGESNDAEVCPTSFGKKCPICDYRAKLLQDGADWKDETVKSIKASDRNLYIVVPKNHKEYDEKPHVWDISQWLFQNMLNDELEENEDYGGFPDLEDGLTLRIRFSTEKLGKNEFASTSRIDFVERENHYKEDIIDQAPNLDEMLSCLDYATLEAKFFEMGETAEEKEPEKQPQDDEKACPACEGTGTNNRGRKCQVCDGTGVRLPATEEKETPVEPQRRTQRTVRNIPRPEKKEADVRNECPSGHKFGDDCEEFDDCDTCDKFEACLDVKEGH